MMTEKPKVVGSLASLSAYLFEQLDRLSNDDLSGEELKAEIKRTQALTNTAQAIIHNAQLGLNTAKFMTANGMAPEVASGVAMKLIGGGENADKSTD